MSLSQGMSACNAPCSAGHLLTWAASQDLGFSERVTSLCEQAYGFGKHKAVLSSKCPSLLFTSVCLFLH